VVDRYAVIGNPVAHSRSPWIHAEFARATGQALRYEAIEAPPGGFASAVAAFLAAGGKGLNVTLPFKEEAYALCAEVSERAKLARAVNTLVFREKISGDNTDGVGLVRDLAGNLKVDPRGKRVLLMGAGGAAQGVAGALLEAGAAALVTLVAFGVVPALYAACEEQQMEYTIGLGMNAVLQRESESTLEIAAETFLATGQPQRLFTAFEYQAATWHEPRWVVVKCEVNEQGPNRRAVVTNRPGARVLPQGAYDDYADRGESENQEDGNTQRSIYK